MALCYQKGATISFVLLEGRKVGEALVVSLLLLSTRKGAAGWLPSLGWDPSVLGSEQAVFGTPACREVSVLGSQARLVQPPLPLTTEKQPLQEA